MHRHSFNWQKTSEKVAGVLVNPKFLKLRVCAKPVCSRAGFYFFCRKASSKCLDQSRHQTRLPCFVKNNMSIQTIQRNSALQLPSCRNILAFSKSTERKKMLHKLSSHQVARHHIFDVLTRTAFAYRAVDPFRYLSVLFTVATKNVLPVFNKCLNNCRQL